VSVYLRGGDLSWSSLGRTAGLEADVLAVVDSAGRKICVGTADADVRLSHGGSKRYRFTGAVLNSPRLAERYDPYARQSTSMRVTFEVSESELSLREIRRSGVPLQMLGVDVYWKIGGSDFEQTFQMLRGNLISPRYDSNRGVSTFTVEEKWLAEDEPFPPVIASQSNITSLLSEHSGKPYPVIVGDVKRLPLLCEDSTNLDDFIVMLDRDGEWSSPNQVSAIYDSDDSALAEASESQQTDADGNKYIRVTTTAGASSGNDVSADVVGHKPATVGEVLRYLSRFFGDGSVVSWQSTRDVDRSITATLGIVFNSRMRSSLEAIKRRICSILPIAMLQRWDQYVFIPFLWGTSPVAHLYVGRDILGYSSNPTEIDRGMIATEVVLKYGRECFRGQHVGVLTANSDNYLLCKTAKNRYGKGASLEVDAGDLSDESSARWLLDWLVETHTKMRVHVGYRCALGAAVQLDIGDTVLVDDEWEGWENVLFKVVGVSRSAGATLDIELLSVRDYSELYGLRT